MTDKMFPPAPKPAQPTEAEHLAREIDKRRLSPAVIAAGLGNVLTLLAQVLRDQETRIYELEQTRTVHRDIISVQGARLAALRRQIAAVDLPDLSQTSDGGTA